MTIENHAVSGLKWGGVAKVVTQVFAWAVTLIVIRILEPADYGVMALSAVITSVVAGASELGLGASLVQAANLSRDAIARVAGILLLVNFASMAAVVVAAPALAAAFGNPSLAPVLAASSAQFLLSAIAAIPQALAYRDLRFKWLATVEMVSGLAAAVATLALALAHWGVWSLVLGNLFGALVRAACLLLGGTRVRPVFRLGGVGRLLRFGGAWSGARLAWQLTYQMDIVIAGRLLSQEAVGIYAVAMQLANIPLSKAMGIVNQVAFSTLSKLQDDRPRMRARMLDALRLLAIAAVPTLWGIGAVAPELVDVVLDDEWRRVAVPLQIIAIVAPLRIVSTIFATALSSAGRADVELINTLVSLAVFIAALLVGVRWNIEGLAIGYAVAVLLSFVLNLPRTTPIIDLPMSAVLMKCRSALMAGAVMIAAVAIARWLFNDFSAVARLVLLSVSGAVLYTAALHVLDRSALSDARRLVTAVRTAG